MRLVACLAILQLEVTAGGGSPVLVSFNMNVRLTLSADTAITLLRIESWNVLSLRAMTLWGQL